MPDNWTEELTHEKITSQDKAMLSDKFKTQEDVNIGYVELQKTAGKPYKLPENLDAVDKWNDENDKKAFRDGMENLKGGIKSEDELNDIDFADGLGDARDVSDDFVKELKNFAVVEKMSKSQVTNLAKFINMFNQNLRNKQHNDAIEEAKAVRGKLSVLYGGDKAVDARFEQARKLFQSHAGLTAEEYEASGKSFFDKVLVNDAVMSKAIFNLAKDIVSEGTTEKSDAANKETKTESMAERQNRLYPILTGRLWPKK